MDRWSFFPRGIPEHFPLYKRAARPNRPAPTAPKPAAMLLAALVGLALAEVAAEAAEAAEELALLAAEETEALALEAAELAEEAALEAAEVTEALAAEADEEALLAADPVAVAEDVAEPFWPDVQVAEAGYSSNNQLAILLLDSNTPHTKSDEAPTPSQIP
jgi:hypothetical protein